MADFVLFRTLEKSREATLAVLSSSLGEICGAQGPRDTGKTMPRQQDRGDDPTAMSRLMVLTGQGALLWPGIPIRRYKPYW